MSHVPTSLYVDVAERAWVERRAGVHWKTLWEEGDRRAVTGATESVLPWVP